MKDAIIRKLNEKYTLNRRDMGELKSIHKGMFSFDNEAYEIENVGNLFFMNMKGMFGLMKMQTVVITPLERDLSICNFDVINAMGNYTGIFEMYRSSINEADLSSFEDISKKYDDLPDYRTEPRWYDEYKLPSSISKKGKKIGARADAMLKECLDMYLDLLDQAPECDAQEKKKKTAVFVDRLIAEGGPAVDNMKKLIGSELTGRLIREFMYHI